MRFLTAFACLLLLAGCGSSDDGTRAMDSGTSIASGSSRMTLGVNSFLWHASLDTLSFLPLQSADRLAVSSSATGMWPPPRPTSG